MGTGKQRSPEKRRIPYELHVTPPLIARMRRAAAANGMTLASWCRQVLEDAAVAAVGVGEVE